jgi:hypothetical protein
MHVLNMPLCLRCLQQSAEESATFEVLSAVLLKTKVFWNVTSCLLVVTQVSEDRSAYIFRVREMSWAALVCEGTTIVRNVGNFTNRHNATSRSLQSSAKEDIWM